jgi:hypothetical protein
MNVAIFGGCAVAWLVIVALVKHERGWVGISDWKRFELRLVATVVKAADGLNHFASALVALVPAMNRVTVAFRDLYAAIERTAATVGSDEMCPPSSSTRGATRTTGPRRSGDE